MRDSDFERKAKTLKNKGRVLFDDLSRDEFGPISSWFKSGRLVETEVAGKRVRVSGIVSLGPSFGADGNLITSSETYLELSPGNPKGSIEIGLVRLAKGSDIEKVVRSLNISLPSDVKVMSLKSFIDFEKNYWKITASHDGYLKKYNSIHERNIEFYPEQMKFVGNDKIIRKKNNHNFKFDIRFHLEPNIKLMKTQDNKSILIELEDEGWKFTCDNYDINIDNGLYFGNKNSYIDNQNIFISGISNNQTEDIKWQIKKI